MTENEGEERVLCLFWEDGRGGVKGGGHRVR